MALNHCFNAPAGSWIEVFCLPLSAVCALW
jgi:hypothetical protein